MDKEPQVAVFQCSANLFPVAIFFPTGFLMASGFTGACMPHEVEIPRRKGGRGPRPSDDVLSAVRDGGEQEMGEWCSGDDVCTHDFGRHMTWVDLQRSRQRRLGIKIWSRTCKANLFPVTVIFSHRVLTVSGFYGCMHWKATLRRGIPAERCGNVEILETKSFTKARMQRSFFFPMVMFFP